MKAAIILCSLVMCLYANAQKPQIGAVPNWITITTPDLKDVSLDKHAEDGYADVAYERQVSLIENSVYYKSVVRIISDAGVQNRSEVSVHFDPQYQQLIFHTIRVIRNGNIMNQLVANRIKTIHQESDLNRYIYNGTLNAIVILNDIRKGDIIEYSFTRKGFNPVFNNLYSDDFSTGFSTPLYFMYYKIVVPKGRIINTVNKGETMKPLTTVANGVTTYEWKKTNIEPIHPQDKLPEWYAAYPGFEVSEFNTWKEVNDWAMKLFSATLTPSPELKKQVQQLMQQYNTLAMRTSAALKFVQDDIRYMGVEIGVNSHKPGDPNKILKQRFGDCKEKSYLLCCMLRMMGIKAEPVLINTTAKQSLTTSLPAATAFDHVTVRVLLDDVWYWFDPTISGQRGNIKELYYPDYQYGLVITDSTDNLTLIHCVSKPEIRIKEVFHIADMSGKAKLVVTTTYNSYASDNIRDDFANNSLYEMKKNYQNFYASYMEGITIDSLTYTDDSLGMITTKEYYTVKELWKQKDGAKKSNFEPFVIQSLLKQPKDHDRTMPFQQPYPANYFEEVELDLPDDWDAKGFSRELNSNTFLFSMHYETGYKKVVLKYHYQTLKDVIEPEEAARWFENMKEEEENCGYTLTEGATLKDDDLTKTKNAGWTNVLWSFVFVAGIIGFVLWRTQR